MVKKADTKSEEAIVRRAIRDSMRRDMEGGIKPLVLDRGNHEVVKARARRPASLSIKDNLLRIVDEADPIGFLISVQRGDLQPVSTITEDDEIETRYVQPGLNERIAVAQFLTHKVLPTISITKRQDAPDGDDPEAPVRPGQPGAPTFSAMVAEAARLARAGVVTVPDNFEPVGDEPVEEVEVTYGDVDTRGD